MIAIVFKHSEDITILIVLLWFSVVHYSESPGAVLGGFLGFPETPSGLLYSRGLLTELFSQPLYFYTNYSYTEAAERCMNYTFISNFSPFAP